jgi:glutamate 5-kinase
MSCRAEREETSDSLVPKESREGILPRLLIVKIGTKNLCNPAKEGNLNQAIFGDYARQIVRLQELGVRTAIVSSGAIQTGREYLKELGKSDSNRTKAELFTLGQALLMSKWTEAFKIHHRAVGQILITYANLGDLQEKESARKSAIGLLDKGDIPIFNENGSVSDEEIVLMDRKISENDNLARMTAFLLDADAILFLTDEGGVYTSDPKNDPNARKYEELDIQGIPANLVNVAKITIDIKGTGGMGKKLDAALDCRKKGLRTTIAGREKDVILKFAQGESVGTALDKENRLWIC